MLNAINQNNIILCICAFLILLAFLPTLIFVGRGRKIHRMKLYLLFGASIMHFFYLCIFLSRVICAMIAPDAAIADVLYWMSLPVFTISVIIAILCILCSENGAISIPKGKNIPISQIVCTLLPLLFSFIISRFFPTYHLTGISWSVSLHLLWDMILIGSEKHLTETENSIEQSRGAILLAQIQPHFIFNTLSSILSLCKTDSQAAAECIENLSGYLRSNIDALTSDRLIPFDDEMAHIRQYISLEQADPSHRFKFDYELDVRNFMLPALTVQPIVENAVKHGALTRTDGLGYVLLTTEEMGNYVKITVTDNGTIDHATTHPQKEKMGIGISNTQKRLQTLCGGGLTIKHEASGTKAVFMIPK